MIGGKNQGSRGIKAASPSAKMHLGGNRSPNTKAPTESKTRSFELERTQEVWAGNQSLSKELEPGIEAFGAANE